MIRASMILVCLACAAPATAQQDEPIGRFAADVRGIFARHKVEPSVATELEVTAANMPTRSFGLAGGGHVYVWHTRRLTVGVGGEVVIARGARSYDVVSSDGKTSTPSPVVRRHFTSFA